jgi:hypothetical protein
MLPEVSRYQASPQPLLGNERCLAIILHLGSDLPEALGLWQLKIRVILMANS